MKNIILQHFDGELRPLDKLSMKNIQAYAEMVGAEYKPRTTTDEGIAWMDNFK